MISVAVLLCRYLIKNARNLRRCYGRYYAQELYDDYIVPFQDKISNGKLAKSIIKNKVGVDVEDVTDNISKDLKNGIDEYAKQNSQINVIHQ